MGTQTIFAQVRCSNIPKQHHLVYQTFWQGADAAPHARLGGVAAYRERGSPALRAKRKRLEEAGLEPGPTEDAKDFFIMRMRDLTEISLCSPARRRFNSERLSRE
jgi:hypothetical protein